MKDKAAAISEPRMVVEILFDLSDRQLLTSAYMETYSIPPTEQWLDEQLGKKSS